MKSPFLTLISCAGLMLPPLGSTAQMLLTFDDVPLQSYGEPIPAGYAGFQWDYFGVLAPQDFPGDAVGHLNGMVSPRHAAFPAYANFDGTVTGGFRSVGFTFDLNSAYLTAAWNDGLQMKVLGFRAGVLTDSKTFTLDTSGPIRANFGFLGIDSVKFISSGGIHHGNSPYGGAIAVLDNLVVTIPEPNTVSLSLLAVLTGYGRFKMGWRNRKAS